LRLAGTASLSSDPSCATTFDGILLCGSQDSLGRPVIAEFNTNVSKWSKWTLLDSGAFSPVGCALTGDAAALTCAYLESFGEEVATWSVEAQTHLGIVERSGTGLEDNAVTEPSCLELSTTEVWCAVTALNGQVDAISYIHTEARPYSGNARLAGYTSAAVAVSAPSCAGTTICAWLNAGGHVFARKDFPLTTLPSSQEAATMTDLGGVFVGRPQCIPSTGGKIACFAVNVNSQVGAIEYTPPGWGTIHWSSWANLQGSVAQDWFSCVQTYFSDNLLHYTCVVVASTDHTLYFNNFNGSSWGGWSQVDPNTTLVGRPDCKVVNKNLNNNVITCLARGPDRSPLYTVYTP